MKALRLAPDNLFYLGRWDRLFMVPTLYHRRFYVPRISIPCNSSFHVICPLSVIPLHPNGSGTGSLRLRATKHFIPMPCVMIEIRITFIQNVAIRGLNLGKLHFTQTLPTSNPATHTIPQSPRLSSVALRPCGFPQNDRVGTRTPHPHTPDSRALLLP